MGKELVNKIRGMNPLARRGTLLLLALLVSFSCVFGLREADAAPTASNAWTNVYAATATTAAVNLTSTTTFTANTGTNRLLLVAVNLETAAATTINLDATPTYGGVALTPITSTFGTSSRIHTWMGFLPDATIPAGAQTVNFQASCVAVTTISGAQIKIGTYTGVDQNTPVSASVANYAAAITVPFPTGGLAYLADSVVVVASANSTAAITPTYTSTGGGTIAIITGGTSGTGGFSGNIGVSATNAAAGTYTTAAGVTYTAGGTRSCLVAVALKAYVASTDVTKPTMLTFTAPSTSTSTTISPITMTASDNIAVTGYAITESATPPAPSAITSATPLTSYTAGSEGTKTLYAWVKDAAGNVSNVFASQSCTITLPPKPVRTANWSSLYAGVAYPTSLTYSVAAGSNRLLVVAIASTMTAVGTQTRPVLTYGGKTLTYAKGDETNAANWNHSYLYYLTEADIAAASNTTLTVSMSGGTSYYNYVYAAVYTGVDQANPVPSTANYFNAAANSAVGPFSPTLTVDAQHQAVEVINLARSAAGTTARTITTGWATGWTTAGVAPTGYVGVSGPTLQLYIRDRAVPTSTVNDGSQHTAGSTSTWDSMTAMSIKPAGSGLTISTGSTIANKSVYTGDLSVAVDAFNIVAAAADTVTNITITGSAATTSANVSEVRVYRKVGADTTKFETGDVEIARGTFSGNIASLTTSEVLTAGSVRNYIVVYDIAANAAPSLANTLSGYVSAMTATTISALNDPVASSAIITIYPTTTIGNGTEPATARLYKASAATNLDAFSLVHNSAQTSDNDNITTVTVTLTPPEISGSGSVLSKISKVEVVNEAGTVSYGSMTAATTGDIWNIPTTGLTATSTPTNYFIRITTAANIVPGFYTVGGTISSVVHAKGTNKLANGDQNSATLTIDVEAPIGPASMSAATTDSAIQPGGNIDLSWGTAEDPSFIAGDPMKGLHPTTPYIVKRSAAGGTDPAEYCTDGTTAFAGNALSLRDSGLNDTSSPIYHYRVCAMDALGNISIGTTANAASSTSNYCHNTPDVTLGTEDPLVPGTIQDQIIRSEGNGGSPFNLTVTNMDIGTCPNVTFNLDLVQTSIIGGTCVKCDATDPPPSLADFTTNTAGIAQENYLTTPPTVTLGKTAGPGGTNRTSATVPIYVYGKATADQIQKYVFKVQVSEAQHPSVTTAAATGVLNDMPPIVHNANNMAKYQYGNWGNDYTCATCHSNSTTNIKGIFQIISTPIGRRNVVLTNTSTNTVEEAGSYSTDKRTIKNVSKNVCSVCHHRTRQHQYSANKLFGGPSNDVDYNSEHHNNRDCVECHTHNTAFRSILGVCGDCHGFKGTNYAPISKATMAKPPTNGLGTAPPSYGAHQRHNTAKMSCAVCHSNTNHGLDAKVWVGDDKLEIGFKVDSTTFPGFNAASSSNGGHFVGTNNLNAPYVWTAGPNTTIATADNANSTCNTYCHGGWTGNVGSNTTPNWVGTGQAACGTCHNATAITPPVSGSHVLHAGAGATGLGKTCSTCHSTYANYTGSAHINGNVEWNLSQVSPTAAYNSATQGSTGAHAPTPTANYKTCSNLYCHSNVQGANGLGAPTSFAQPLWGDNGVDSTTVFCGSCHIVPNTTGGHQQHESLDFAFDCHVCHNNGGRTSPLNHANSQINLEFVGLGQNTVYSLGNTVTPGSGYGTCSTSDCHGRYVRAWGPPTPTPQCEKCHGSRTSARGFYNTRGPDGTLSIYSAAIGVHDIHLQNPNSPRKATFNRFTSFALGMNCNQCHYTPTGPFSAGHMDNALPAEAEFAHMSSIAHTGESFGYYSTPKFTAATQTCSSIWCHGAGMASNTSKGKYAGKTPGIVRQDPKWDTPMLATGNSCTKCHAMPPPASSAADTHWNVGANRAYIATECVGCHQHVNAKGDGFTDKSLHINGKIDGGCTGCHGNPPTTTGIGTDTGLASPAQHALQTASAGAHTAHMNNVNIKTDCYTCHYNYNPTMPSNNMEIGFNGFGGKVKTGTFTGYTNTVNGPKWLANSAVGGTTTITKVNGTAGQEANVCSNLYCHGSTIPSTVPANTMTTPNWELSNQADCGTCHGADPTNVPLPALNGAHTRHASSNNNTVGSKAGLALGCDFCHGVSAASMSHVNGEVTWELNTANIKTGPNATYKNASTGTTGALAPSATYGTCQNFYCHSNVQGAGGIGSPTTYNTMTWGSSTGLTCGSCHLTQVGTGTGSHAPHTALYGGATACGYCHHAAGANTELHADGMIYVNITSSRKGAGAYSGFNRDAGSAAGYGSCSNVICHGAATLKWGTDLGTVQCHKCHGSKATAFATTTSAQVAPGYGTDGKDTAGNTAATAPKVGAHQRHLSSNAITTRVKCSECHVKVTNVLDNGHLNYSTATITFTGRAVANGDPATAARNASGTITCSTAWCHSARYNTGTKLVPVWNDTAYLNETGTTVAECLACHAIPPKGVGITDHESITVNSTDALSTLGAKCNGCHTNVKASPTSVSDIFVDKSLHVNGVVEGGSCLGCHASVKGKRAAVVGQFASQSHHIQGNEPLTTAQCYKCHMEADATGAATSYHQKTLNASVDLITNTATRAYISYTANGSRKQIAKINSHCMSCHNSANAALAPFGTYQTTAYAPEPKMVPALGKTSIQSRYSSTRTVLWSNYTFTNSSGQIRQYGTNKKNTVTKALSAHGNAVKNQFPAWSTTPNGPGEDEPTAVDIAASANLSANRNVLCYDCHNSHGSDAAGFTSSYSSATGRYKGGLLKSTIAGQGGYDVTYKPASRSITYRNVSSIGQAAVTTTTATFEAGASICNDCHNNDTRKVNINKPWSITQTYSSTKAIVGYWSTPYFDNYTFASAKRYVYKAGVATPTAVNHRTKPMGGHFGSSVSTRSAGHAGDINGLCTPCHDPHGVSSSMTAVNRGKSVPLLKGTWVTSPYREDAATPVVKRGGGRNFTGVAAMGAMPGYNIDQNTLIALPAPLNGGGATTTTVSQKRAQVFTTFPGAAGNALALHTEKTPADFAGLCVGCHNQASLTNATAPSAANWKSKERVHQSVAGWAATTGTNANGTVHAYTCSKCHAPHVSRLPRLMVTNCLDVRHTKQVVSGGVISATTVGTPGFTYGNVLQSYASSAYGAGRFPAGGSRYSGTPASAQNNGPWYFQTTQPTAATYGSNCHNATNAGGATYNPTTQIWNKKTVW